ncbi:hypothetical protein D3C73_1061800 [compost metagenome]
MPVQQVGGLILDQAVPLVAIGNFFEIGAKTGLEALIGLHPHDACIMDASVAPVDLKPAIPRSRKLIIRIIRVGTVDLHEAVHDPHFTLRFILALQNKLTLER